MKQVFSINRVRRLHSDAARQTFDRRVGDRRAGAAGDAGVALIEFSIALPFLLLLTMAIWDLGRALNEYLTVSRIVYEGTRYAASVPGLETPNTPAANVTEGNSAGLSNAAIPVNVSTHQRVRDRISQLIARYGIPANEANITTKVVKDRTGALANNSVTVGVRFRFRSNFPLLDQLITQIGADSTGPYMFP